MRQYRTKISTWVVLITGLVVISLLMLFYVDAMQRDFEAIDNDGDSVDSDGDLYPDGQERALGTSPFNELDHPGNFVPPIPPDDPEKWINEDDFDWDESPTGTRQLVLGMTMMEIVERKIEPNHKRILMTMVLSVTLNYHSH